MGGTSMGKAYAFGAVVCEELLRSVVMGFRGRSGFQGRGWPLWGVLATAAACGVLQLALLRNAWAAALLGGAALGLAQIGEAFLFGVGAVCLGQALIWLQSTHYSSRDSW